MTDVQWAGTIFYSGNRGHILPSRNNSDKIPLFTRVQIEREIYVINGGGYSTLRGKKYHVISSIPQDDFLQMQQRQQEHLGRAYLNNFLRAARGFETKPLPESYTASGRVYTLDELMQPSSEHRLE